MRNPCRTLLLDLKHRFGDVTGLATFTAFVPLGDDNLPFVIGFAFTAAARRLDIDRKIRLAGRGGVGDEPRARRVAERFLGSALGPRRGRGGGEGACGDDCFVQ
ncbi:Uu.00g081070.m01.CDS01 [Anthostomella pinea]|uniref:Uu.00g081070.m01.CDS01 n=1 Tax=Anthostomella pinea TaxID=933095 RepID=A0AAI8VL34_9PEZI|nr:Uu.00g081070.m01.CDS01 [Anthostomella pinea]